jgi:hypothetical protein
MDVTAIRPPATKRPPATAGIRYFQIISDVNIIAACN